MENSRTHAAARHALIAALASTVGCQSPNAGNLAPVTSTHASTSTLAIRQVADGSTQRYVFCTATTCPVATPKTPWGADVRNDRQHFTALGQHGAKSPIDAIAINLPFAFNAVAIGPDDHARLRTGLLASKPRAVKIIGRSDPLGPLPVRERIARVRAEAVRKLVLRTLPEAQVTIDIELPTSVPPRPADRSSQRRATVRFIPSTTHP